MNLIETECRFRFSSTYEKASSRMKLTTKTDLKHQTQSQMMGLKTAVDLSISISQSFLVQS